MSSASSPALEEKKSGANVKRPFDLVVYGATGFTG